MALGTRTIKRRIKSINNTKKITKAMEMVAASKMRKATKGVLSTRPYSAMAWRVIGALKQSGSGYIHPLLREKTKKSGKYLVVLIATDRGLCGGLNSQLFREIKTFLAAFPKNEQLPVFIEFVIIGRKGEMFAQREKLNLFASFPGMANNPKFIDIKPIAKIATQKFIEDGYDNVYIAYTDYFSTLVQKPRVRQLLPVIRDTELGEVREAAGHKDEPSNLIKTETDYIFEPTKEALLKAMAPKILETQVYQAILESAASEHSARMVAMKNAGDAAAEMVSDLTLMHNKLRQATITREISEISAGKAALE